MPLLSFTQLTTQITEEEATDALLTYLDSLGFGASSWQTGSLARTIVQMGGFLWSNISGLIVALANAGFNDTATEGALTAFSRSQYDNERILAVATTGYIKIVDAEGIGPTTVAASDIVITDTEGHQFRNVDGYTIPQGGTVYMLFSAVVAGEDYNIATNYPDWSFVTGFAGFTISNPLPSSSTSHPEYGTDSTSWIVTEGSDEETDEELRARNTAKWGTISVTSPQSGMEYWAKTADPLVARVQVDDSAPRGAGSFDVYIASDTGVIESSSDAFHNVEDIIDIRRPITSSALVKEVTPLALHITGTIYIKSNRNSASNRALIEQSVTDYINSVPIGGDQLAVNGLMYSLANQSALVPDVVVAAAMLINGSTDDIPMSKGEIASVADIVFTYTNVTSNS